MAQIPGITLDDNYVVEVDDESGIVVIGCDCSDGTDDPLKVMKIRDALNEFLKKRGLA